MNASASASDPAGQFQRAFPDDVRTPAGLVVPPWLESLVEPTPGSGVVPTSSRSQLEALKRAASTQKEPLDNPDRSAVLILFSGDSTATQRPEDASVVLMHRATTLRKHAGQMSFPGGRMDDTDRGPVHTALREAEEETGLRREAVSVLRVLDPIDISRTGYAVYPVIAHFAQPHPLQAMDPAETDLVLTVPISELIDPKNRLRVGFDAWSGPAFHVDGFVVWGFTAGVLNHVLDVAGWSEPWQDNKIYDLRETLARSRNQESFGVNGRLR